MQLIKKRRASSVLGLMLDVNRLEAVVVRRSGTDGIQVRETANAALALSPLSGDPELVGQEIRNHLDQAGIRERRCALSIPLNWVLSVQTKLPDLQESDIKGFLELEAERGFPSGHENLHIVYSLSKNAAGERYATLLAIPRNHLETLEKVLKAAQLKPLTFALGAAAMDGLGQQGARGMITLALSTHSLELMVIAGGGIIALRSLDGAIETEGAQKQVAADLVARELRITLGQLPGDLSEGIRNARLFARGDFARQFVSDVTPRIEAMGLRVETMDHVAGAQPDRALPPETALSPALAVATDYLLGRASSPDFILPKVNPIKVFIETRMGSKRLGWAAAGASVLLVCAIGLYGYQEVQIMYWNSKMTDIAPQVKEVEEVQKKIATYRAWFDESNPTLRLMRMLSESFPDYGNQVSVKTVQVRDLTDVTCTGFARDNQSYRAMLDALAKNGKGVVSKINTDSLRAATAANGGSSQLQFSFTFQWKANTNAN